MKKSANSYFFRYSIDLFNFHHRVVETKWHKMPQVSHFSLTFTIGWLKRRKRKHLRLYNHTLTFTIGWLKLFIIVNVVLLCDFNFHHRVVETGKSKFDVYQLSPLTFTIGWLKRGISCFGISRASL